MSERRFLSRNPACSAYVFGAFVISAMANLLVMEYCFDLNSLALDYPVILITLTIGLLILGAVIAVRARLGARPSIGLSLQVAWGLILVLAIVNITLKLVALCEYGDWFPMTDMIAASRNFPRWLVGTALLNWFYAGFWNNPYALQLIPARLAAPDQYVKVMGTALMCGASVVLLRRWRGRLAVALPTLIPLWFLLATGYLEYYPFIAWALLGFLAYVFSGPSGRIERLSPVQLGALVAAIPLVYVAFLPIAVMVFVMYVAPDRRRVLPALGMSAAAFVLFLRIFYAEDIHVFFKDLYENVQFEDRWTYGRYLNKSLLKGSSFFSPTYAFSGEHLSDMFYMYFYGGGLVSLLMLAGVSAAYVRKTQGGAWAVMRSPRARFAAALVVWHFVYMMFYLPRLGPRDDIDLFFCTFVVVAFFAGHIADRLIDRGDAPEALAPLLMAASLGNCCVVIPYLVCLGLPSGG